MIRVKNKSFEGLDLRYRGSLSSVPWSLCVGAGICFGMVPTWQELTRRTVNSVFGACYNEKEFNEIVTNIRWSLDALIQGVESKLLDDGKDITEFGNLLEKELYSDIRERAKNRNVEFALVEALNNPRVLNKDDILSLCDFFETVYPSSSTLQIAKTLSLAKIKDREPQSIINFNADTILYGVLDIFLIKQHYQETGVFEFPKAIYKKSLRAVETGFGVIPIYHCRGSISPMPSKLKKPKRRDSREKLVFKEQDYLEIAGSMSTWAQTVFSFFAQSTRMVIVGHSLADPNIRKWLSWVQENTAREFATVSKSNEMAPRHLWISTLPNDRKIKELQEVGLLHLGIRVCWIKSWSELGDVMSNLLALDKAGLAT